MFSAPAFDGASSGARSNYDLALCHQCQLVSTLEVESEVLSSSYSTEYYGSSSSKFIGIIERALSILITARARKLLNCWQAGRNSKSLPTVLDIGCGRGQLLLAFQSLGAEILGFEREEFPIGEELKNKIRTGSISESQYVDRKFDIVILWHVLEHIERPEECLEEIVRHLNPGGLLVIAVPNFASLQRRIFNRYWFHLDLPRHLVHFDEKWIKNQMVKQGLTVLLEKHTDLVQNGYGFIQSLLNTISPAKPNQFYRLLKHGTGLQRFIRFPFLMNLLLSTIFLPFAVIEGAISAFCRRGATIQLISKLEKANDQR